MRSSPLKQRVLYLNPLLCLTEGAIIGDDNRLAVLTLQLPRAMKLHPCVQMDRQIETSTLYTIRYVPYTWRYKPCITCGIPQQAKNGQSIEMSNNASTLL